jgi:hypothetical protein
MIQTLRGVGRWLVHDIGRISREILVLTAIVYAATRWGRIQSSRVRRWLWTLVVTKPLTTLLIAWPQAVEPGTDASVAPMVTQPNDAIVNIPSLEDAAPPSEYRPTAAHPDRLAPPPAEAAELPIMDRAGQGGLMGFAVIGLLWLLGSVGLGVYSAIGIVWLMRVSATPCPSKLSICHLTPSGTKTRRRYC